VIAEKAGEIRDVVVEKASEAWDTASGSSAETEAENDESSEDETAEYPAFESGSDEES